MKRGEMIAAALALTGPVTLALADGASYRPHGYVVTRPAPGIHSRSTATVEHAVGQRRAQTLIVPGSAVFPQLGRLVLGNAATIYLDPAADYQTGRRGRLDENHTIVQAQDLLRSRQALPTRTVVNPLAQRAEVDAPVIQPRAIIQVPRPTQEEPAPKLVRAE